MSNNINTDNMLRIGTVLHGTYCIDGYLSSGGFGNTYIATNIQFEERYAIKEFFMRGVTQRDGNNTTVSVNNNENEETFSEQREKFKKEARRLHNLHDEHIVHVYDLFEDNGTAYYVMDYVNGEALNERLKKTGKPLDEQNVLKLLFQILDALDAAHANGIWHLDLKPANIMVDKTGIAKLIDFGASKQQSAKGGATATTAVSFTNGYAPREQMEQNLDKFGPWTDFYALGATLYTLLTNRKPSLPSDIDDDGTKDKHLTLPLPSNVSPKTKDLILWLMSTSRTMRPQNVAEIRDFLKNNGIASTHETVKDNEVYEGDTIVEGAKPNSIAEKDSSENGVEIDNEATSGKKRSNLRIILCIVGGIIIGTLIFFLITGAFNASKPIGTNMDSTAIDTTQEVATPIKVEKYQCKVSQGTCTYTGTLNSDSIPNGQGEARFTDGRYYKGNFDNGRIVDDNAYFRYPNGDHYEGSFANDHLSKGKYTIAEDQSYFVGTYDEQGQPKKGVWYSHNGNVIEKV